MEGQARRTQVSMGNHPTKGERTHEEQEGRKGETEEERSRKVGVIHDVRIHGA